MTVLELSQLEEFHLVCTGEEMERRITGVYCCDLLSIAMGRAKADSAWVTVMANVNVVAVAVLTDVSCVILAEGMTLDQEALKRASEKKVAVITTPLPVFEAAKMVDCRL